MRRRPFLRSLRPGQVRSDESEDIRNEIELYLELRTEELVSEGMERTEARRIAEERFGDTGKIQAEMSRQARRRRLRQGGVMTMGGLRQDLAFAIRTFRRNPGFTLVAIATLGLALGGNTAIYSVVNASLLQAMPFENHEELVYLNGYHLANGEIAIRGASYPEFRDWQQRTRSVSPMAAVFSLSVALSGDGMAESVSTEIVTADYFRVLQAGPLRGRLFTAEEHAQPDAFPVAVISHSLWLRRYGSDPDVLGAGIVLNDRTFTVVGVMGEGFGGTAIGTDVWIPESMVTVVTGAGALDARGSRFLSVIGRLTVGPEEAQRELDAIAGELQTEYPEAHEDRFAQIQGFRDAYLGSTGRLLWVLLGAGIVLLLIAAANVSNLLLVRSHQRTREIVLRRALGAESRRVASQLLTESVLLAALGGILGLGLAYVGLEALVPMIPPGILPGYVEVKLNASTFLFSLSVLGIVGVVMGLAPAMGSSRLDISTILRQGGRSATLSFRRLRAQHVFVVAQISMALVLMVGAGLLVRSFRAQLGVDTGSDIGSVVAMRLSLPASRYPTADARREFASEMERRVSELPGTEVVSISSNLPFRGGSSGAYIFRDDAPDDRIRFHRHSVTPGYLETLGLDLVAGRFLTEDDVQDSPGVGVITAAMARRVFPNESPIGQTMYLRPGRAGDPLEIVGVIEDLRYRDLTTSLMADGNSPDVFFAFDQVPSGTLEVATRVQGDPNTYVNALRELAAAADPDLPVYQVQPLFTAYEAQTATPRFAAFLMGLLSALAIVLACVGIYGVLAFAVGQRAQEIAIRRAIGASVADVARSVVGDGLKLAAVGLLVGGVGAAAGSRILESFLFEISPADPMTFLSVGSSMIALALLAAIIPSLRAMRRDPADALNAE